MTASDGGTDALSSARRWAYALGNAGFQIPDRIVIAVAVYFYLPPAESDLVPLVSDRVFFGVVTAYGAARLLGGFFDSLADPIIGHGSDRSRSPRGRRRAYMIWGVAPMAVLPVLLFWPPGAPGSTANFAALSLLLALYYVFFTVYVGPYLALLPEIAPTRPERVDLSTRMAVLGIPVAGGFSIAWLVGVEVGRDLGLSTAGAIRAVVVVSSGAALALCLAPILAVDERRLARGAPTTLGLSAALGATLRDRPFLVYLGAQILFILGFTMVQPAVPYYAVVVLGRSEGYGAWLAASFVPGMVAGFVAIPRLARRVGPKATMLGCVTAFGAAFAALGLLRPDLPGGPHDLANHLLLFTVFAVVGVPIAGFAVLPYVFMGELIDADAVRTGANRSAMYFGVQGLLTKWVYAASLALLSLLFVRFGNSREAPDGVLSIGPVVGLLCAGSAVLYALYPERRVAALAARAGPTKAPGREAVSRRGPCSGGRP